MRHAAPLIKLGADYAVGVAFMCHQWTSQSTSPGASLPLTDQKAIDRSKRLRFVRIFL